ncbi:hypothetical protein ACFQAQ_08965 [Novosphingobium resinovorum]|uniref:hypothetical protein n=1 Tax=Novosphingobium resinovorum TaxID=158500 RepID=UPI0036229BF9
MSSTTHKSADKSPSPISEVGSAVLEDRRAKPPGMTVQPPSAVRATKARTVKGRGTICPSMIAGVVERWTISCPQ